MTVQTGAESDVPRGRTTRLRPGTYAFTINVWAGGEETTSLIGTQVLSVTRNRTVTFDGRKSHLVQFKVADDPTAEVTGLNVLPLVNWRWAENPFSGWSPPHGTYVIPSQNKHIAFVAHAVLQKRGSTSESPSPYRYDLARVIKGGIPQGVSFSDTTSKLARIDMTIRSFDEGQTGALGLRVASLSRGAYLTAVGSDLGALPRRLASYRSPGFKWHPGVAIDGPHGNADISDHNSDPVYPRGRFRESWGQGVWGPSRRGPSTNLMGRALDVSLGALICQPPKTTNEDCELDRVAQQVRLYQGGRLIREGKRDFRVQLPLANTWYRMQATAARPKGALLSTRVTGVWRFKARGYSDGLGRPGPKVYTVHYVPRGLDLRNRAARGTLTSIPLWIQTGYDPIGTIRSIKVEASTDGGKTWQRTAVKREQKHWVTQVRNPAAPGFVWLRATVVDTAGNSAVQTIANAYGVR